MTYQKLGLKCGIEIHQQLKGRKLFSHTPTLIRDDDPTFRIKRKLRASAGESGKIDVAAAQEQARNRTFIYEGYDTVSLVECDSEPPHEISEESLYASLQFCKMVDASISPVIQVMRKTVVDGSNSSGFQRTALVGRAGKITTSEGDVRISNISIEEDSARPISETFDTKTYRLDRLGIPLIEIGTEPDIKSPEQCQEAARQIGMMLRSLPNVKRGLGTIRQDVNVSIVGGRRIEIKGAQDLRQIPTLVGLEAKRQEELLNVKRDLHHHRINDLDIIDLTVLLQESESTRVKDAEKVLGIRLVGFSGILGKELQPNYRVGSELSGRAKVKAGVGGIFHSDELPNYGITESEVRLIRKKLKCESSDGFVLVADSDEKAKRALEAVHERAMELQEGVPGEVRRAKPDGTTIYMRPIPGAARMYPETDVPLISSDIEVEVPELYTVKIERFQNDYGLSGDQASFVAKSDNVDLFEEIVSQYDMKPAFVADVLTAMLVEIRRKYKLNPSSLTEENFRDLFIYLSEDKIHKDIVLDVLIDMIKGNFDITKYEGLSTEEIHAVVKEVIVSNKGAPFGALMGMCMKKLAGKASGQVISKALKELMG